jgi:CheY-like chemotaxis protein
LQAERAAVLAARFSLAGVPAVVVKRRGVVAMQAEAGGDAVYVVGRDHEAVVVGDQHPAFVQQGLLRTKLDEGDRHPFIRAIRGTIDSGDRARRILDLTAGLGGDAMHAASSLDDDGEVLACETSVVLHALLEEGLGRLGRAPEFGRIVRRVRLVEQATDHRALLRALPDDAFDVVIMDPMMRRPLQATPSFEAVRAFGLHDAPDDEVFREARRVAPRVVLKLGQAQRPPVDLAAHGFGEVLLGVRVVYHVATRSP